MFYFQGVYLKNKLSDVQPEHSQWPPRSEDLIATTIVPVELFNHIAHITGAVSDDEYTDANNARCVNVDEDLLPKVNAFAKTLFTLLRKAESRLQSH